MSLHIFYEDVHAVLEHINETQTLPKIYTPKGSGQDPWDERTIMRALLLYLKECVRERQKRSGTSHVIPLALRDTLFDHTMDLFDVMTPYKGAWVIVHAALLKKGVFRGAVSYAVWGEETYRTLLSECLEARHPNIPTYQVWALYPLYYGLFAYIFWLWSCDPDPHLSKTMAQLDHSLHSIPGLGYSQTPLK